MCVSVHKKFFYLFILLLAGIVISCTSASSRTVRRTDLAIKILEGNVRIEIVKYYNRPMYWNNLPNNDVFINDLNTSKKVRYAAAGMICPIMYHDGAIVTIFAENNKEACILYNGTQYYIEPQNIHGFSFIVSRL